MAWLYLNGLINPPAAPVDAMSYVALIALAVVSGLFYVLDRQRARADR